MLLGQLLLFFQKESNLHLILLLYFFSFLSLSRCFILIVTHKLLASSQFFFQLLDQHFLGFVGKFKAGDALFEPKLARDQRTFNFTGANHEFRSKKFLTVVVAWR